MDSMVGTTLTIEIEIEDAQSIRDGSRVSLLPVQERSIGLLVHDGSRVAAIRARDR